MSVKKILIRKENRGDTLRFRVSSTEKEQIIANAARAGLDVSVYLRWLALRAKGPERLETNREYQVDKINVEVEGEREKKRRAG